MWVCIYLTVRELQHWFKVWSLSFLFFGFAWVRLGITRYYTVPYSTDAAGVFAVFIIDGMKNINLKKKGKGTT